MTYIKVNEKCGKAVGIASVKKEDEVIVITDSGMIIRVSASEISQVGRTAIGVKVVNLQENEKVIDFALITEREEENE